MRVYEEVLSGAPLNAINVSDIDLTSVPASQIKYTVQDNAGTVTNIVLGDVTGEAGFMVLAMASEIRRMRKMAILRNMLCFAIGTVQSRRKAHSVYSRCRAVWAVYRLQSPEVLNR